MTDPMRDALQAIANLSINVSASEVRRIAEEALALPQPAPDAMPEAEKQIDAIKALASTEEADAEFVLNRLWLAGPNEKLATIKSFRKQIIIATASLSATVLPADGAGLAGAILNSLEEVAKYLRRADPATIDMDGNTQILLTGIKQLRQFLPPSATGAAEPSITDEMVACALKTYFKARPNTSAHENMRAALRAALYAASLVRGDREILEQCAKVARQFELDMSGSQLDDRDIENIQHGANVASNAIADAILSLPVQPGAGERRLEDEELAEQVRAVAFEECLEIIQGLDSGRGNERTIIDRIRDLRQPPQSSREGVKMGFTEPPSPLPRRYGHHKAERD